MATVANAGNIHEPIDPPVYKGSIPARTVVPVTASDTVNLLDGPCRALLVGTAGVATVIDSDGNTVSLLALQAGYNPVSVRRVFSTGLTAANIWALY